MNPKTLNAILKGSFFLEKTKHILTPNRVSRETRLNSLKKQPFFLASLVAHM